MPGLLDSPPNDSVRWVAAGLHGLFVILVVIATAQADSGAALLAGSILALWYVGGVVPRGPKGPKVAAAWLVVLSLGWAVVTLFVAADFVWLAFPLYFLHLFVLPTPIGVLAVGLVAAVAIFGLDRDGVLEIGEVIGPTVGAGVAVVSFMAYRALAAEYQRARHLLAELVETRGRLVSVEREKGALEERRRLAREVHDTIAQGLSSIVLLTRAEALSASGDDSRMRQIGEIAQHNLDEARRIVSALSPPDLAGRSLSVALERAADATEQATGFDVDFQVVGKPYALTVAQEIALLRVAQGALANASAHARADHVQITLTFLDDRTTVDVVDDGVGFDPVDLATHVDGSGFGFQVMRDRLASVDGELTIETAPGEGTAVVASIVWSPS